MRLGTDPSDFNFFLVFFLSSQSPVQHIIHDFSDLFQIKNQNNLNDISQGQ